MPGLISAKPPTDFYQRSQSRMSIIRFLTSFLRQLDSGIMISSFIISPLNSPVEGSFHVSVPELSSLIMRHNRKLYGAEPHPP